VRNDHVLAIVKLKEEELERYNENESINEENSVNNCPTKLTRLKAKELNKTPLPLKKIKTGDYDEEVAAFIAQDLASDDDDEEYDPLEDDTVVKYLIIKQYKIAIIMQSIFSSLMMI